MSSLTHLPADCTVDDMLEVSDRDGGLIVDGWLHPDLVDRLNTELDPLLAAYTGTDSGSAASDEFLGHRTRRLQGLAVKTPTFVEILTDDRLFGYAMAIVGPISPTVILNNGEVIDIVRQQASSETEGRVLGPSEAGRIGLRVAGLAELMPLDTEVPDGHTLLYDTEWKVLSDGRLIIKQVRPFLR